METNSIVYDICRHYLEDQSGLPTPLQARLLGFCRARNLEGLATSTSLFDSALHELNVFPILRQVEALFKKNALFVRDEICLDTAICSFSRAEKLCRITNRRLDHYFIQRDRLDPDLELWLSRMERSIYDLLGKHRDFLEILPSYLKMTSGATATRSRKESIPAIKLSGKIDCSPKAVKYLAALQHFFQCGRGLRAVRYKPLCVNRVEFVPKNYKTHRTIACEPTGNVPLQLAFDRYVKERLKTKFKVDLTSQVLNQRMAKEGSITGRYATVDLSMASDTLAYNTVAWLLPNEWFRYVDDIRSTHYLDPRTSVVKRYAKFSSMGNGTTFGLETLVFAAAVRAVGSRSYAVYGDDIVIESELYDDLVRLLSFLGFTVNEDKSFRTGPFRESCGCDYLNGIDITPFYLREWGMRKSILSHNVNGLASISKPYGKLWQWLKALVEERSLALVPYNLDSMTGIWIDVPTSYALGLFRHTYKGKGKWPTWSPWFRAYLVKSPTTEDAGPRSLFLWYMSRVERLGQQDDSVLWYPVMGARNLPRSAAESSVRIPTLSHKYVRKWVQFYPQTRTPVHLYIWTEFLLEG